MMFAKKEICITHVKFNDHTKAVMTLHSLIQLAHGSATFKAKKAILAPFPKYYNIFDILLIRQKIYCIASVL